MHPGPINRGVEISSVVADSANSIILQQVENGVAIRMAVDCLGGWKSEVNRKVAKRNAVKAMEPNWQEFVCQHHAAVVQCCQVQEILG